MCLLYRAAAQFLHGIIVYQSGDSTGARMLLTKALKQAHTFIGSAQLVGQVKGVGSFMFAPKNAQNGPAFPSLFSLSFFFNMNLY